MTASTRDRVLRLISRKSLTIPELSAELGVTRNAVVVQLQQLAADGLVRRAGRQRTGVAGKPGHVYEMVPGNEDRDSDAYRPLVAQIVEVLGRRLQPDEIAEILEEAGEGLAREAGLLTDLEPDERLARAVAIVNSLGACAEVVEGEAGQLVVENRSCPFAFAVRRDACVCRAAAAFFRAATGLPFEQKCDRAETLTCRYVANVA